MKLNFFYNFLNFFKLLGLCFVERSDELDCVLAQANYVELRAGPRSFVLRETISGFHAKLDPARFVRIQRSYIANLDHVASIEPLDTGDARVHMKDGANLPCSRTYRSGLKQRFGGDA